jgi:hypothetical protein
VPHPSLERLESDSSKKSTSSNPLTCWASVKVLFRRQVYSNSSTGLEKSVQGVWNTPPSSTFGALLSPAKDLVGKEIFAFEKILVIWTYNRSLEGQQGISGPVSLIVGLLGGLFSHLSQVGHLLTKDATLRINLNIDGTPISFHITHSPFTLSNLSSLNLVFIFSCSSPPRNPVSVRRVDLADLDLSRSSHQHSYLSILFSPRFVSQQLQIYRCGCECCASVYL